MIQSKITQYNLTEEQRSEIVKETLGQSSSSRWFLHRKGWITGSVGHRYLHLRESSDPEETVAVILEGNTAFDPFDLPHAIKYGKVHEPDVLKLFIKGEKDKHKNFRVH